MEKGFTRYTSAYSKYELNVHIGELSPGAILKGKTVFITGGARGIGYAIAQKCIQQGANVILAGRDRQALYRAKKKMGKACESVVLDMHAVSRFDEVLEQAADYYGDINCLINNAGISLHEGDFMNVTEEGWNEQLNINLKGPFFLTQAWLRYYERKGLKSGRIVMMASDTSGMGSTIPYGISKAGISSFTRGLAKQVIKRGIRVNAIAPGTTKTDMTTDFTKGEIVRDSTQGNRVLFPDEIAEICVFILSDASACMSGNVFGCTEANICFDNTEMSIVCECETNP